jgi:hypothetical protein
MNREPTPNRLAFHITRTTISQIIWEKSSRP